MSARVAYWVSSFEPELEAVAKEVTLLRREFPGSWAWGITTRRRFHASRERGIAMHPGLYPLFWGVSGVLQARYHINHLFGGLGDWYHLKSVWKRPVVMTVALETGSSGERLLEKVDRFVVEWPQAAERLKAAGIAAARITVIPPPVDLDRFRPAPAPKGAFKILFASSPERADWLYGRGVDLIVEAARRRPDMEFVLCWRPWGDAWRRVSAAIEEAALDNVHLVVGRVEAMERAYQGAHVTVFCPRDLQTCKPVPNSIVESLACGRPVVVSHQTGWASAVAERKAGLAVSACAYELVEALDRLKTEWDSYAPCARQLAEELFGMERFLEGYRRVYEQVDRPRSLFRPAPRTREPK